jgi:hypothetical protein
MARDVSPKANTGPAPKTRTRTTIGFPAGHAVRQGEPAADPAWGHAGPGARAAYDQQHGKKGRR